MRDDRPVSARSWGPAVETWHSRRPSPSHFLWAIAEIALLLLFAAFAVVIHGHPGPLPGDVGFERDVQSAFLHSVLTAPLEAISTLDFPQPVIITLAVITLLFLLLRRWLDAGITLIAAGAESLTTYAVSILVHRPRPAGYGIHVLQHLHTFSFPSGHVTYAVTVYGLFIFLTTQIRRHVHPALIWLLRLVFLALILLMPISRILEGEHWPSDTLGGALWGLFWLVLFAHLFFWARSRWPRLLARDER